MDPSIFYSATVNLYVIFLIVCVVPSRLLCSTPTFGKLGRGDRTYLHFAELEHLVTSQYTSLGTPSHLHDPAILIDPPCEAPLRAE